MYCYSNDNITADVDTLSSGCNEIAMPLSTLYIYNIKFFKTKCNTNYLEIKLCVTNNKNIKLETEYWTKNIFPQKIIIICNIYLFGVLRRFQHCTGHITTGSWKGRGNQYIQLVKVLYCKLPTNGKQLQAFPLEARPGTRLDLRGGRLPVCHCGPYHL